jgi:D-serine deaminase-like pyridoxal phosphate-dependent protein
MDIFSTITQPTLLLDEARCLANIQRMVEKAKHNGVRFRPHFKTHQSAVIGEWFRPHGVTTITVSSVGMAQYFATHGWDDIAIAFPINLRQMEEINTLAATIHLELLAESSESIRFLAERLRAPVDVWLKADVGAHRSGIPVDNYEAFIGLAKQAAKSPKLNVRGVLTHAGHTYHAGTPDAVREIYIDGVEKMTALKIALQHAGFPHTELSWGDTPSCSLVTDLSVLDEMRPGNFVLYDAIQLLLGSCLEENIAAAVACPVVAVHPERNQAVIYGGAIHLSKDSFVVGSTTEYGLLALPENGAWGKHIPGAYVASLSQEHGLANLAPEDLAKIKVGDLLLVLPAHLCLTVNLFKEYLTLTGERIPIMA